MTPVLASPRVITGGSPHGSDPSRYTRSPYNRSARRCVASVSSLLRVSSYTRPVASSRRSLDSTWRTRWSLGLLPPRPSVSPRHRRESLESPFPSPRVDSHRGLPRPASTPARPCNPAPRLSGFRVPGPASHARSPSPTKSLRSRAMGHRRSLLRLDPSAGPRRNIPRARSSPRVGLLSSHQNNPCRSRAASRLLPSIPPPETTLRLHRASSTSCTRLSSSILCPTPRGQVSFPTAFPSQLPARCRAAYDPSRCAPPDHPVPYGAPFGQYPGGVRGHSPPAGPRKMRLASRTLR